MIRFISVLFFILLFSNPASSDQDSNEEMVFFPAGEFEMGSPEGIGKKNEHPKHKVYLSDFYLDRLEVTFADFEVYLAANLKKHPTITGWVDRNARADMLNKPIFGLQWKRCRNYCSWRGKRIPTEAEWERAARGIDNRAYPWGNEEPDKTRANFGNCCFIQKGTVLSEVDHFDKGKTPEGISNMGGNVAEWVSDWYDKKYYEKAPYKNPQGPKKGKYHVIRGGAWNSLPMNLRSSSRYGDSDGKDYYGIGCRCAKDANPPY
ncbi:MAG: formylglycine-generating enzyme family protein [Nitrospina sp.]|jgi:formylglycine-generating enzyme required for sulfatase activity|nr:formylglycine-generating enzyme family protein [Nitrospina sp.]